MQNLFAFLINRALQGVILSERGSFLPYESQYCKSRERSLAGPSPPPLAFIETQMRPDTGLIFFMFQRGLGLVTEPARMPDHLDALSNPRFSLFDRTSGRFGSLDESPIKQGFFESFASDRLQPCQILSRDQRKQKWTW